MRDVGPVTRALCAAARWATSWACAAPSAPTGASTTVGRRRRRGRRRRHRSRAAARRGRGARRAPRGRRAAVFVLVGARDPSQVVFADDLAGWPRAGRDVARDRRPRAPPAGPDASGWSPRCSREAGFDAARTRALVCGPEIMMRFTARALVDHGVDPTRILVSLERNMQCGVGLVRPLPARPAPAVSRRSGRRLRRRGRAPDDGARAMSDDTRRASRRWPCGSSPPATAASSACSTARTSCSTLAGAVRIAHFTEMSQRQRRGPLRRLARRGSITTPEDAERIREVRAGVAHADHDRRVRDRRRDPGAAQLRRRRRATPSTVYAHPEYLDASTPRRRSPPTSRSTTSSTAVPIDRGQLLEVITRPPRRPPPGHPGHSGVPGVQGPGHRLSARRATATPCLGPVTRAGCGALCPVGRPRLLRLLRPGESANTASLATQLRARRARAALDLRPALRAPSTPAPRRSATSRRPGARPVASTTRGEP